ncbi:MAG: hypothetical protein KAS13_01470 [Candidatus Omnitrophica bacterium]|nr:hypothetical protein [Candidatus Omnitrophota bacterium]
MGNRVEKCGALIVLIAVIVLFVNCSYVQAQVLEDKVNGYSFEYPFDWKAKAFPNSRNLIRGEITKDNNTGAQIRIYQNTGNFRKFVDKYVDDFMRQMQKHWGGEMIISDEKFTIVAGYECFVISFDFTRKDNKRWFFKQYLWPKGAQILILQSGTLFELRTLNEPSVNRIAESLQFME